MSTKTRSTTTKMKLQHQAPRSSRVSEAPTLEHGESLEAAVARLAAYVRKHAVPQGRRGPA